jgi:hypothetical protein
MRRTKESNLARVAREVGMPPEVVVDVERQIDEYIAGYKAAFHDFWKARNATATMSARGKTMRAATKATVLALLICSICPVAWAGSTPPAPTQVTLTLSNIVGLAITTGLLTAMFNQLVSFLGDVRSTKRQARSLALNLISVLETFANACSHEVAATHYYSDEASDDEQLPNQIPVLPVLRSLGDSGEWSAIDKRLGTSASTMNNERDQALQSVTTALSLVHREHKTDYVFRNFYLEVSSIGLRAAYLARDLRTKYGRLAGPDDSITNSIDAQERETADLARSAQADSVNLD